MFILISLQGVIFVTTTLQPWKIYKKFPWRDNGPIRHWNLRFKTPDLLYQLFVYSKFCAGSYFCSDNPAALEDNMKNDLDLTTTQYELFYSLYSWPNVVLCFFGGYLLDRVFGVCWGTILFSSIVTVGQVGGTKDILQCLFEMI